MELDSYVATHRPAWERLDELTRQRRRLTGDEVDELLGLYQRTATHLSVIRASAPDAVLVGRLSALVARARGVVSGAHAPAWKDLLSYFVVGFPAALYRSARWWVPTSLLSLLVATVVAWWIVRHPEHHDALVPPAQVRELVEHDFAAYYTENPASDFAFQVWVNNARVAAMCLVVGVAFGIPVVYVLWQNVLNVGVSGGFMVAYDKADVFFGLITPHGLLELTAVFVAAGAGMRLGWSLVQPGPRTRMQALAETGRETIAMALGLAVVLCVTGLIEGFVTPSPLPTWARIGIGVVAEVAFLLYVFVLGRRVARAGETGDMAVDDRENLQPIAG